MDLFWNPDLGHTYAASNSGMAIEMNSSRYEDG
jgi:hypothetical protein